METSGSDFPLWAAKRRFKFPSVKWLAEIGEQEEGEGGGGGGEGIRREARANLKAEAGNEFLMSTPPMKARCIRSTAEVGVAQNLLLLLCCRSGYVVITCASKQASGSLVEQKINWV